MNKIIVEDEKVIEKFFDQAITLEMNQGDGSLPHLKLIVKEDTELEIEYRSSKEGKLIILIEVLDHVHFSLWELRLGKRMKVQYQYDLHSYSETKITRIHGMEGMRELDLVYLNGEGAHLDYLLKAISIEPEKYDFVVYHRAPNTTSNLVQHGINLKEGSLIFNVTGDVPREYLGCEVNQKNRIVTYNLKECKISPNLFIDTSSIVANHSAYIGKFRDEELFYMMSRGISEKEALKLLMQGFFFSYLEVSEEKEEMLKQMLEKVWR